MSDTIINVNNEMNHMQKLIAEVDHCTRVVKEINANSKLYRTNEKINIITIVVTLYQIAAAILRCNKHEAFRAIKDMDDWDAAMQIFKYNTPLIIIGVILAIAAAVILILDHSTMASTNLIFIIAMIASSIVFFMLFYTFVPFIFTFLQWMILLVSNYRMKKQVWTISRSV